MKRDPYIIDVPPGADHLDLRPVLEPIVRALLSHDLGVCVSAEHAKSIIHDVDRWGPLIDRMMVLEPVWVYRYLKGTGWYIHKGYTWWQFNNRTEMGFGRSPVPRARSAASFCLKHRRDEVSAVEWWKAFESIADWERVEVDVALTRVEDSVSVVDRLAAMA